MPVSTASLAADQFSSHGLLETLLDISLTGVNLLRPLYGPSGELTDFALEYLNPAAQRMTGLPQRPDGTARRFFPDIFTNGVFDFYRHVCQTGETGRYDFNYQADGLDNYFQIAARRSGAFLVVSFTDTSDHDRTPVENALRQSQDREKQARAEAEAQRQRLHEILMQLPAHVAVNRGPDHVFELVNPPYQQLFPLRPIEGLPAREALPELEGQQFFELLDQVYRTGEPFYGREMPAWVDFTHTGRVELRYFDVFFQALRNAEGSVEGVLNFSYDVTGQVTARKAVEESEARFRSLADNSPDIITRHGKDYRYLYASPGIETITGIKAGALIGKSYREIGLPEASCAFFDEHLAHVFARQSPHTVEYALPEGKGHVLSRLVPECNEQGEVVSVLVLSTDITERKRVEAALRSSEERLQQALSIQTVGVIFFDLEGRIHDANSAFEAMSGYAKADFEKGTVRWDALTAPQFMEATLKSRQELLTKGENTPYQKQYLRPDGSRWWGLFSGKRLSETECVEFVLDITERKEAEEATQRLSGQLARANANLSAANQLLTHINQDLDTFVYTASHDLKAPISNIEGLLKALQRQLSQSEPNPQEIGTIFGFLNQCVVRFKTTIADLTEVARISKESTEDIAPIDLEEMLGQVQLDLSPQIAEAKARVEITLACRSIHFSRKNLKSILYNLLSNAVKYRSPDRAPFIRVTCQPEGEYYCLTVRDNGLGMDMRQEEKIFALFKRLHAHVEGTGIGLYIVKKMVENAGGRIEVESQLNAGSAFKVYLKR